MKSPTHAYMLKGIPLGIWRAAQAKAAAMSPPTSMRWIILDLLKQWIAKDPPVDPPTDVAPPPTDRPARRVTKPTRARTVEPPPAAPDLGIGF